MKLSRVAPIAALLVLAGPPAVAEDLVIGHIESARWRITVLSSVDGPRYTVRDRTGRVLLTAADDARLAKQNPDAWRLLSTSLANTDIEWAGL